MPTGKALLDEITRVQPEPGTLSFWWIGQLGYAMKAAGRILYVDAYLSPGAARIYPPVFPAESVVNADIVIGTHDHSDHIDRPAWKAIAAASPQAVFVCAAMHVDRLSRELEIPPERFVGMEDGLMREVKGVRITGIKAAHEKFDRDPATGRYPYLGFCIETDGVLVYHCGDTCVYEGLQTTLAGLGRLDALFLPINGRDSGRYTANCIGNMTFQEAVDLAGNLEPRLAVPGHYEMFANNLENVEKFEHYLRVKWPEVRCWTGAYGVRVDVRGGGR